jgi:hypothetical protein
MALRTVDEIVPAWGGMRIANFYSFHIKTLQCEKKLKIFKKCFINLRFMDTLLTVEMSLSARPAFLISLI